MQHPEVGWLLVTDQELATGLHYPDEHAAGGETSLLMAIRPELVDLSKTLETSTSLMSYYWGLPEHLERHRTTPKKYIGVFTAEEGGVNDPELSASLERGQELLEVISTRIAIKTTQLLSANDDPQTLCGQNRNKYFFVKSYLKIRLFMFYRRE